ncbi:hypothetical protein BEWA_036420 [Theileria equi strain WA]|uniref:Uncharacterized protein n=1 Tax=Theileria equi strain WA TaxID=1537102 RepID=L1LE34_THEEQ|nr:hypothetical protein BEWA_036420 [Theileria equi strain WA]EKX73606.1 hypothetical protein BEWA_036420 [Theileria equi strain WA]|eukprot:XP_004833058.1 hypothetical protein BEWA_036420 [Theileria equi strain WA]
MTQKGRAIKEPDDRQVLPSVERLAIVDIAESSNKEYKDRNGKVITMEKDAGEHYSGFKSYSHMSHGNHIGKIIHDGVTQKGLPEVLGWCYKVVVYYLDYDYNNRIPLLVDIYIGNGKTSYNNSAKEVNQWSHIVNFSGSTRREQLLRISQDIGFPISINVKAERDYVVGNNKDFPHVLVEYKRLYTAFAKYVHKIPGERMRVISTQLGKFDHNSRDRNLYRRIYNSASVYYWVGDKDLKLPLFLELHSTESHLYKLNNNHWVPILKPLTFDELLDQENFDRNKVIPFDMSKTSTCRYMRSAYVTKKPFLDSSESLKVEAFRYKAQKEYQFSRIKDGTKHQVGFDSAFKSTINVIYTYSFPNGMSPYLIHLPQAGKKWYIYIRENTWGVVSNNLPKDEKDLESIYKLLEAFDDGRSDASTEFSDFYEVENVKIENEVEVEIIQKSSSWNKPTWLTVLEAAIDISWKVLLGLVCYKFIKKRV